jgi:nucleoside-diphosphate-sugar epimerase
VRVLITGGTGFIGINITEKLVDEGLDVVLYALNPIMKEAEQSFQERAGKCHFVRGDILDAELLDSTIKKFNITSIIHAAAVTPGVLREMKDAKNIINVNCLGTIVVLEAARKNNIDKFIYLSSLTAYGKTAYEDDMLIEDRSVPKPNSLYEISKFAAERIALRYKQLFGMNIIATRIGEVFGAWEHDTGLRDTLSAPFQTIRLAILGEKALLPRAGNKNWVYSKDIANAIYALLKANSLNHDVYNVSSNYIWSIEQWCKLLSSKYPQFNYTLIHDDVKANIDFYAEKDHSPLQINRLTEDTDYVPFYDLEKSFEDYTKWADQYSILINS